MTQKQAAKAILLAALLMPAVMFNPSKKSPALPLSTTYSKTHTQIKLEKYIGDKYIAECIAKSKYPYLMAAIGKVESDYRPQIVGDNGASHGLFQIQPKYWKYDDRVEHQVDSCGRILKQLITKHGLASGVARYNGSGPRARSYSKRVIELAREIEKG